MSLLRRGWEGGTLAGEIALLEAVSPGVGRAGRQSCLGGGEREYTLSWKGGTTEVTGVNRSSALVLENSQGGRPWLVPWPWRPPAMSVLAVLSCR